jgi:hypothetical protein
MKTYSLFAIIIVCFFAVITAMVRPDIVEQKYLQMRDPIDNYFAEKNAKIWNDAKETERAIWLIKLHLPADCGAPKTAMRGIECHNLMQLHIDTFEQNWANKVRGGWKPEGV